MKKLIVITIIGLLLGVAVAPSINAQGVEEGKKKKIIETPSTILNLLNETKLPNLLKLIQSILSFRIWTSAYLIAYSMEESNFWFPPHKITNPVMFVSGWIQFVRIFIWFKFWYEISENYELGWEDELFPDIYKIVCPACSPIISRFSSSTDHKCNTPKSDTPSI